MIAFPLWFKIFLGVFCFLIFTGAFRRIRMVKVVQSIKGLPVERKKRFIKSYETAVKAHTILLILIPLNLIAVPYFIYKYQSENFFHLSVLMVLVYLTVIDDFLYRRSISNKVKETLQRLARDRGKKRRSP